MKVWIKEDGKELEICLQQFVDKYSNAYFICNSKIDNICYSQSSWFAENQVLNVKFDDRVWFARMIAWKIGKIKHKESKNEIKYARDWIDCESKDPMRFGEKFELGKLHSNILQIKNKLLDYIKNDEVEKSFGLLWNNKIRHIGTVYLITILYFLSNGKYPIYDRFVDVALDYINRTRKTKMPKHGDSRKTKTLTIKKYIKFKEKMDKLYKEYYSDEKIDYLTNRELDRALWVYGHGYINER